MPSPKRAVDFRIGASQGLLLTAALSPDKAAAAAALEEWWRGIADFDDVRGTDAALFPRIYANLGAGLRDRTLAARLKGAARHHWLRNQYLIASCSELLERLNGAGIPALLMKGAAIATAIDDDPGLRAMSDCDILVPRELAVEVLDLLTETGLLDGVTVGQRDLDVVHGVTLGRRNNRHAMFDIHWRPLRLVGAAELATEMFAAARTVGFAGQRCLAPCPEHMLFHTIIHGTDWSPFPRYDWLIDAVKILRRTGAAFDWDRLADVARRYRFGFLVGAALMEARDKAGVPVPDRALRRLHRPLAVLERREALLRLSPPSAHSAADEMLLALQSIRRRSAGNLRRPALAAAPTLLKSLYGPLSASRSFIDNDRKERISFLHGWSAPEAPGRWTEGHLVSFAIYAPEAARPALLKLRGFLLPARTGRKRIVDVFAGHRRLGRFRWSRSGGGPYVQSVALPPGIWRGDTAVLRFRVRTPISPIDIGLNGDTRALGVFVQELSVDAAVRDAAATPVDLTAGGSDLAVLWHGWSTPEAGACWTVGPLAILRWRAARDIPADSWLAVEIAQVAPGAAELHGRWLVNGQPAEPFAHAPGLRDLTVRLPIPAPVAVGQDVDVRLELDNPRAPARTPGNGDWRPLGLFVRRIRIEPPRTQS